MLKGLHGCFLSLNMAALLPNLASPGKGICCIEELGWR
jgi:hypothetical protein